MTNTTQEVPEETFEKLYGKVNMPVDKSIYSLCLKFREARLKIEQSQPVKSLQEIEDQIEAIFEENFKEHKGINEALLHSKEQIAELYAKQPRVKEAQIHTIKELDDLMQYMANEFHSMVAMPRHDKDLFFDAVKMYAETFAKLYFGRFKPEVETVSDEEIEVFVKEVDYFISDPGDTVEIIKLFNKWMREKLTGKQ